MLARNDLHYAQRSRCLEVKVGIDVPQLVYELEELERLLRHAVDAVNLGSSFQNRLDPLLSLLGIDFDTCVFVGEEGILEHCTEALLVLLERVKAGRVINLKFGLKRYALAV